MNGDRLRDVEGIFKDKLHVLSGAQAGVEQVLGGYGPAQHVADCLRLAVLPAGFDLMRFSGKPGFRSPILTAKDSGKCLAQSNTRTFCKIWKLITQTSHCTSALFIEQRPGVILIVI